MTSKEIRNRLNILIGWAVRTRDAKRYFEGFPSPSTDYYYQQSALLLESGIAQFIVDLRKAEVEDALLKAEVGDDHEK